jgi:hypothetical protein
MEQQTQPQSDTQVEEVKIEDPAAVLGALERAKAEAKKFREEKEKLENDLKTSTETIANYSSKLLQEKVKSNFEANGIKDSGRFMRFIDFNQLSLDENNEVAGLDDQITALKNDLPEIFDPKLRVGGQADTAASTSVNTRISATELQARKILGKI